MGSWIASWRNMIFNGFSMQSSRPWAGFKRVWQVTCWNLKRFGWLRILMKNGCPNGSHKSSKSSHWAPMVEFLRFCEVLKGCVFWWVFGLAKSLLKNWKNQRLWQTNWFRWVGLVWVGGRGGVPGKKKSWGLEDCMYLLSGLARRTEGGGGLKATAFTADPYVNWCWWIYF